MNLKKRIEIAAGRKPADLLLKNAQVVSVFDGASERMDVAIADGVIVGFGAYKAKHVVDLKGAYLSAGFMDSHVHIESTLLTPAQFANAVVPHGTTSVVADPHEIANVLGERGIKYMLEESRGLPLDIYLALPSCVPASNLDTSGARLNAAALKNFADHKNVIGIGEVMDYLGVIHTRPSLLAKLALKPGMRVDGHAPGLSGRDLYAYVMGNISSDHESTRAAEALQKLRAGLHIMVREGSSAKNLEELVKIITPANSHRMMFCTDDLNPEDLVKKGHIDVILKKAVALGLNPITALQMATNNAPYYFRIPVKKGAVAVGYQADLVVLENLKNFRVMKVYKAGKLVAQDGSILKTCRATCSDYALDTMHVKPFGIGALELWTFKQKAKIIKLVLGQIITKAIVCNMLKEKGMMLPDVKRDILKLVVVERHKRTGNIGVGFVCGFGLKRGALAGSVSHDSHNIIAVGVSDEDILTAVHAVIKAGGGLCAAAAGQIRAMLELPIAGLMSEKTAPEIAKDYSNLAKVTKEFGCEIHDPFQILSFLALPVIPELKLTDKGLVDVRKMKHVELFV